MKKSLLLLFLATAILSCEMKNDYVISSNKVGNLRIGDSYEKVKKKLPDCTFMDRQGDYNGFTSDRFYSVLRNNKRVMDLKFSSDKLNAVKVYSSRYMTGRGVKTGLVAQEVINIGHGFWAMNDRNDGFLANASVKKGSDYRKMENVYFLFEKKMTSRMELGKFAKLKSIFVGEYFNLKALNPLDEKKLLGQVENNIYKNDFFKFEMSIPEGWIQKTVSLNSHKKVYELLFLVNDVNGSNFLIVAEKLYSKDIKDGYDYLKEAGRLLNIENNMAIEPFNINDKTFYKVHVHSMDKDDKLQKQAHHVIVMEGFAILITVKYNDENEYAELKKLVDSIVFN